MTTFRWWVILSTLCLSDAIAQEVPIYRWTTADNVTHYSTTPPAGVHAERLDQSRSRLTVVPATPVPSPEQPSAETTHERIEHLQQELDEMRRQRREDEARALAQEQARVTARMNCEERFRQPCNDNGEPIETRNIIVSPHWNNPWNNPWNRPPVWRPPPPPPQPPAPPPRQGVAPRR